MTSHRLRAELEDARRIGAEVNHRDAGARNASRSGAYVRQHEFAIVFRPRQPTHESKIWTACAPASTCARR